MFVRCYEYTKSHFKGVNGMVCESLLKRREGNAGMTGWGLCSRRAGEGSAGRTRLPRLCCVAAALPAPAAQGTAARRGQQVVKLRRSQVTVRH